MDALEHEEDPHPRQDLDHRHRVVPALPEHDGDEVGGRDDEARHRGHRHRGQDPGDADPERPDARRVVLDPGERREEDLANGVADLREG